MVTRRKWDPDGHGRDPSASHSGRQTLIIKRPRALPPLKALHVFEVAARLQSLTKASVVLNVTHGAVSKQIKLLEQSLGIPVFERRPRRLVLTPRGAELMRSTAAALDIVEQSFLKVRSESKSQGRQRARLLVMCDPDFASLWLMPRLTPLREALRGANIEIRPMADPKGEILKNRGDCAIWYGPRKYRGLNTQRLFQCTLFPICSADLKRAGPALRTPRDLLRHTLLHDRDTREWEKYYKAADLPSFDPGAGEVFGSSYLAVSAALQGAGVAIGDDILCARHLRDGTLVRLFAPSFMSPNSYFISSNPFSRVPELNAALRTWIQSETSVVRRSA